MSYLSVLVGLLSVDALAYRLVELVSHCRIALQWNTVSHICTVIYGTGLSLLHIC
jgi:hypothetical protein